MEEKTLGPFVMLDLSRFVLSSPENGVKVLAGSFITLLAIAFPASAGADEPVDYLQSIKPLLETKCYACHGVLKQEAGLRLDTRALMTKGGDSGPAMLAGNSGGSLILERITDAADSRMPRANDCSTFG